MKQSSRYLMVIFMLFLAQLACIPPQDCELISKIVAGRVQNSDGQPIDAATVSIINQYYDERGFETGRVDRMVNTDADGRFRETISIFRCDSLILSVSKEGYVEQRATYRADIGLLDSLPSELVITLEETP